MGGGSGPAQKTTTTNQLPGNAGYWLNQYFNALGPFATSQFQQLAPYSMPLLQQALGLTQQETFGTGPGNPGPGYFPGVGQGGAIVLPQPGQQAPTAPQQAPPNPYQYMPGMGVGVG